jgi:hypothetical protein
MKKLLLVLLLVVMAIPALAQYRGRLSGDDQRRFDSYYSRWLEYRRTNNRDEIISMEKRMQDVMAHNGIPASTPYAAIATNGNYDQYGRYRGKMSHDDQRRFDSYYSRWLDYRRTSNWDEVRSMEARMRDVMQQYDIPVSVPFDVLASSGNNDGWQDGDHDDWHHGGWDHDGSNHGRPRWRGTISADDQRRFDSYYSRWQDYRQKGDWDEVRSMEGRMRDVMQQYNIPPDVPFEQIASSSNSYQQWPDNRSEVRILNASYGSGSRMANVTQRLQEMARGRQLSIYVNNDSMGGDPAPGSRKTLNITYSYRGGRTQSVSAKEGSSLTIP